MTSRAVGPVKRAALRAFRALPPWPSQQVIRLASPTYTLGSVAIIEHDERVLALRQTHRTGWTLPGGLIDAGEEPAEALRRELLEETGLDVDPGDVVASVVDPGVKHVDIIFRIECPRRPPVRVGSEATAHDWLRLADLSGSDRATRRIIRAVEAARAVPRTGRVHGQVDD